MKGKSQIAIGMLTRVVKSGIYADYLLVDSWHPKLPLPLGVLQTCVYRDNKYA